MPVFIWKYNGLSTLGHKKYQNKKVIIKTNYPSDTLLKVIENKREWEKLMCHKRLKTKQEKGHKTNQVRQKQKALKKVDKKFFGFF